MTNYDEEIYKYLSKEENFKATLEIIGNLQAVKNRIIEEFWKEIESSLKEELKSSDWKVSLESIDEKYGKLKLTNPNYNNIIICFEGEKTLAANIYYGIIVSNKNFNREKIDVFYDKHELREILTNKNDNWLGWEWMSYNFILDESLLKILPENREPVVEVFKDKLIELHNKSIDLIAEIIKYKIPVS